MQTHPTFGFFEWNIPEDKIVLCQRLSEMLAFDTTNTTQSYDVWRRLTHPDDLAHVDALHKKAVPEKNYYVSSETRKLCRDGKWRWFGLNEKIIETNKEGTPLRVTGMCADITKTKDAELIIESNKAERNELNVIFSFFIEHTLAPVAMFDTEMRHKFANTAWKKDNKFGHESEFIGKTHYEIYTKQPPLWKEQHQRALNGEIVIWPPTQLDNYYEETIWYEGIMLPWYTLDGSIGGIIIYSTVVTERIKAENNLKEAKPLHQRDFPSAVNQQ